MVASFPFFIMANTKFPFTIIGSFSTFKHDDLFAVKHSSVITFIHIRYVLYILNINTWSFSVSLVQYVINVCSKLNNAFYCGKTTNVSFIAPIDLTAVEVSYCLSFSDIDNFLLSTTNDRNI